MAVERTLVLVKPDGVQRGLIPDILERFQTAGLELLGLELTYPSEDRIAQHYEEHHDEDFYPTLLDYMVDQPVIAVAYEGVEAVSTARKLVGDTEPHNAAPGTIRGDHAHITTQHANNEAKPVKNLVHAAEDRDAAERELNLWFDEGDLRPVGRLDTTHIR
ncbi:MULTISPECIES: nucleoside-diphosphate kinase [Haloferacaceae]|uniref:Nucleoside diphosphate kinase n=1 Tax=Halorubrum glutamatedens TaxID=2707018 RepID=A0ABD5QND1_9EURY|nr:nucleoside-diphosphate kinase [Halobellus captivus]